MTAREKLDYMVVDLWLAIKDLGTENPEQLTNADLQLIKAVTHHTAIQKILDGALKSH